MVKTLAVKNLGELKPICQSFFANTAVLDAYVKYIKWMVELHRAITKQTYGIVIGFLLLLFTGKSLGIACYIPDHIEY